MAKANQEERLLTANEETNVKDICKGIIYTKDGYMIRILRLFSINIDLLSDMEKESRCNILTGEFKGEKQPFSILCLPRTVDMEVYINSLTNMYDEEIFNPKRKMLLNEMIGEATRKVMSGSNYEHQFFLMIWVKEEKDGKAGQQETLLEDRIRTFENRYQSVQIAANPLDDTELLRVCNLFANSNTALFESYEEGTQHISIPWMKGGKE